jgi:hypothetical protein
MLTLTYYTEFKSQKIIWFWQLGQQKCDIKDNSYFQIKNIEKKMSSFLSFSLSEIHVLNYKKKPHNFLMSTATCSYRIQKYSEKDKCPSRCN